MMTKKWPTAYKPELSLLLSMVFYSNASMIMCENFFSNTITMFISLVSLTCCFLLASDFLTVSKSFQSHYWDFFNLVAAMVVTAGESNNWNCKRGYILLLVGILSISLYAVYVILWVEKRDEDQATAEPPRPSVPFGIVISFTFIGNGVAILGRYFLRVEDDLERKIEIGCGMFIVSVILFYNYYINSSSTPSRPGEESTTSPGENIPANSTSLLDNPVN